MQTYVKQQFKNGTSGFIFPIALLFWAQAFKPAIPSLKLYGILTELTALWKYWGKICWGSECLLSIFFQKLHHILGWKRKIIFGVFSKQRKTKSAHYLLSSPFPPLQNQEKFDKEILAHVRERRLLYVGRLTGLSLYSPSSCLVIKSVAFGKLSLGAGSLKCFNFRFIWEDCRNHTHFSLFFA